MKNSTAAPLLDETPKPDPVFREVALVPAEQVENVALMFERLARDPNASVDKIERLMALWERGEEKKAEAAFNAAMSKAQREMRPVAADAYNPQTKSKYASYEALDSKLRPIYTAEGFGLSFNTAEGAPAEMVRVLCYVTHLAGYCRTYHVDMPADGKGAKGGDVMTKTHAVGAAVSYGMRYLLKMVFNVAVGEDDDDGNSNGGRKEPEALTPPKGFEDWWIDMQASAGNGLRAVKLAFNESKPEYRTYLTKTNAAGWEALKDRASKVGRS